MDKKRLAAVGIALFQFGCEGAPPEPESTRSSEKIESITAAEVAPSDVVAVQFKAENRTAEELKTYSARLLSAVLKQPVSSTVSIRDTRSIPDATDDGHPLESRFTKLSHALYPDVHVSYSSRSDTLDLVNSAVRSKHTDQETDVGDGKARLAARTVFNTLVTDGLLTPSHFDFDEAEMHERNEAQANSDGTGFKSWVSDYRFFTPIRVNGIPVVQQPLPMGVLIVVRRTGEISRVRIDMVGAASAESDAYVVGKSASNALKAADAEVEAASGFTNPVVQSVGIRYVFPPGGNNAAEVPRQVYRVHEKFAAPNGLTGRSKAIMLTYRVDTTSPIRETFPIAAPIGPTPDTK